MKTVSMRFPGGLDRALTFSYDDGCIEDERLIELMLKYDAKATLNLCSYKLSRNESEKPQKRRITYDQAAALAKTSNFEIASHGKTHPHYPLLPSSAMLEDMLEDRRALEEITGCMVRGFAYPFGSYNETVIDCLRLCGLQYARTVESTHAFSLPKRWLEWHPTCHHRDAADLCESFLTRSVNAGDPLLFYIWGHSFEFENNNNWSLLEQILQKLSHKDTIWYATNMEIMQYTEAFRALIYSADGLRIYNPTNLTVWFAVGASWNTPGTIMQIAPNETVFLR